MVTLQASSVSRPELEKLDDFIAHAGEQSPLTEALSDLASSVREGADVVVIQVHAEVSPAEACEWLRMSRPHLDKLLDAGVLPHHRVGRDRRIRVRDLEGFMTRREQERRKLAETFADADRNRRNLVRRLAGVDDESAVRLGF
jgi:excisionase family DNA binding protein